MNSQLTFGLYLSTEDLHLRIRSGALKIEPKDGDSFTIPIESIESVIAGSRVLISSSAAATLRQKGVAVSFLDWRGELRGRLEPDPSRNSCLRRAQVEKSIDPDFCMGVARSIVIGKLRNQRAFLMRIRRKRELPLDSMIKDIEISIRGAKKSASREELMGFEGFAAKSYFSAWPLLLEETPFSWKGRNRRPPLDPINSMLSLGYTIISARCTAGAGAAGLDPYIGFLHAERYGRPELGLDLVEEFRVPWVDSMVLGMIGRKQITLEHFYYEEDGACLMTSDGRKIFFSTFSKIMRRVVKHPASGRKHSYSLFPVIQARMLGKYCLGELPEYLPYLWR